ncbi:mRNA interferase RelE/StbE [Keratinibaculum paraultunense]|uniref:mRNA interferase RelE/StbE n=1 Tax=Keratinibaculum paraultunense TaxID=1278232 RepID=A0A4R3KQG6_9FIRM|nr:MULTISPECIES: type II toxin-antitoxin system RelE/ParE family toxin [Tissierellales]MBU5294449.1 type II toxin-antitoxin system RelE/ParE family toxin [Anaerosalibacter bizertensis]QQY79675.1 type II toxin-antitoxin system RelE/ParE family toxin [Keratinibaculum paraultunense]TCS87099.1 mRNA interferase RelE/StbE [Keratinibaculum paraultunense]
MKYNIKYEKACLKYLKRLDKNTQLRIIKAINQLPSGDVKKLQGDTEDYMLRVGKYRIVFSKDEKNLIINIIQIASRGEVYNR